jgi:hypothetical protein
MNTLRDAAIDTDQQPALLQTVFLTIWKQKAPWSRYDRRLPMRSL